ncbi:MAG: cation:proton antiporter regulatory subunit [Solirubrobacteraceae bacterium]|nr:cation:proton antiporter regulatory subunit [Solirubrobacteraceae bacterium]
MPEIEEAHLPGVGVRHDLVTQRGDRVGVLNKLGGERELLVYSRADPDAAERSLRLDETEAEALAQLLGVTRITQSLASVREAVGDLLVEWLVVRPGSPFDGRTIGDTTLRTATGVSIVAVLHGTHATPAPGPEQPLTAGDTLLVVGTIDGVRAAETRLGG